ncbi:MAG: glycosyltransferase [Anaerolineales bacterium]|nr:glycosyltransferase [Anaerolineales bacterium]
MSSQAEIVILCHAALFSAVQNMQQPPEIPLDLAHADLYRSQAAGLRIPGLASLNWHLLDPHPGHDATSWKATPAFCLLRPALVRALGGFDPAYVSPAGQLLDFAYRLLRAGGRVRSCPDWLPANLPELPPDELPLTDIFTLTGRRFGGQLALHYAAFWHGLRQGQPRQTLSAWQHARRQLRQFKAPPTVRLDPANSYLFAASPRQQVTTITAIIPTINRYAYLPKAIESLLNQTHPPNQIVIVDQTPAESRQPDIIAPYQQHNIRLIESDIAGQSIARNLAIEAATGDWCLFFDDDSEAWEDMVAEHIRTIELTGAEASTGVSLAPWKDRSHIPAAFQHDHLTNVLDTGNSLVLKSAIYAVGGFDRAFDHGPGADNDLGTRLYQDGCEIVFNPRAIRTHHKAPQGGLRTYGAFWRHKTRFLAAFPPPTQVYTVRKYHSPEQWWPLYLLYFLYARRHHTVWGLLWLWFTAPWKLLSALNRASKLKTAHELHPLETAA